MSVLQADRLGGQGTTESLGDHNELAIMASSEMPHYELDLLFIHISLTWLWISFIWLIKLFFTNTLKYNKTIKLMIFIN
jgi:hypothetical protein